MERKITRRDFIKGATILTGALGVYGMGHGLSKIIGYDNAADIITRAKGSASKEINRIPDRLKRKIDEITEYRKTFQFTGPPKELNDDALDAAFKYKESSNLPAFEIDLPEYEESYGLRTNDILTQVFGPDFNRLIYRVVSDGQPGHQEFDSGLRNINLTVNLHNSYSLDNKFDMLILHEGQHGINPALKPGLYDIDSLIRISHGMWRALKKTFKYENNLYYGLILPDIKRQVAEKVAHLFVDNNNLTGLVDLRGYSFITESMAKIARKRGVAIKDLKFSKKVCAELGEDLFYKILSGDITIKGELQQKWQELIEADFVEIIADMFKFALLDPDKIGNDEDIIAGVEEMIAAVQGKEKVSIKEVREKLGILRPEIILRHASEQAYLNPQSNAANTTITINSTPYSVPTFTSQEAADSNKRIEDQATMTDAFNYYVTNGKLPEYYEEILTIDEFKTMNNYGEAVAAVYKVYPNLFEGKSAHNMSFDPDLHIWQTRDIAKAADDAVIWNLLEDTTLIPDYLKRIKDRTIILNDFINNTEAFGTNNYQP